MKIAIASFLILLAAPQPSEQFARAMFGHLRAGTIECPSDFEVDLEGRTTICASYGATFSRFKSEWELHSKRHDLPDRVKQSSHWTLSGGRYSGEFTVGDHEVSVIFDEDRGLLVAIYDPGDDIDTDALAEVATSERRTIHMAGFGGVTVPRLIPESKVEPIYPVKAKRIGIEGSVTLSLVVEADGSVSDPTVLTCEPEGHGFEEAAIEAVKQWKYEPATLDGEPVAVRYTAFVRFVPNR
jgi:TonB family protein